MTSKWLFSPKIALCVKKAVKTFFHNQLMNDGSQHEHNTFCQSWNIFGYFTEEIKAHLHCANEADELWVFTLNKKWTRAVPESGYLESTLQADASTWWVFYYVFCLCRFLSKHSTLLLMVFFIYNYETYIIYGLSLCSRPTLNSYNSLHLRLFSFICNVKTNRFPPSQSEK